MGGFGVTNAVNVHQGLKCSKATLTHVHDLGDVKSLHNLALTSHSFLRRSRHHLFSSHIRLKSIKQLNSFCDFLDTHPERRPWVRLITISGTKESRSMHEVVPVRLLANLPNLDTWSIITPRQVFFDGDPKQRRWVSSNTRKLTCLRHYAHAITQLHLDCVRFQSCADFARYILAFSGLRHLHCVRLEFQHEDHPAALARVRERCCKELHLSRLTIDSVPDVGVTLLLELAQHTLQELVINVTNWVTNNAGERRLELYTDLPTLIPRLFKLSSITLRAWFVDFGSADGTIRHVVEILQALAFSPGSLITKITVHSRDHLIYKLLKYLQNHSDDLRQICRTLETALLRLPRLRNIELCHDLRRPLRSWTPTRLEQFLPMLQKRGLVDTRCLAPSIQSHSSGVIALAASPDGRWIASGSYDATIILWDARRGTVVHEWLAHLDDVTSLTFSPDGRHLASAGNNRKVMVWDVGEAIETKLVTTLEDADTCVWSPDGTIHASGASKGTIQVWSPSTNQARLRSLEGYSGVKWWTAIFSPDGRWTAAFDGSWKIWDATTGRLHRVLPRIAHYVTFKLNSSTFDPAGRRIVIPSDDHSARIWDVETGDLLVVLEGHTYDTCNIAFSPDGTRVLSIGSDDTMVRVWDSFSGVVLLSFRGHKDEVNAVCFSSDEKYVASASFDHTVRLWNASTGSCIRTFTEHDDWVWCVAFSRDGETLVSGGLDDRVCMRRLRDVCPEENFGDV